MAVVAQESSWASFNPLARLINDKNYMWWATIPLLLGMFIVILDSSIVNVALPPMMSTFGSNIEEIEWVATGYMLSSAIMMPTTGFLGERFGRKKLFVFAVFAFTMASMLCGAAWSTGTLIAFRVLQGVVGGAIQPVAQAVMFEIFPPEKRGMSMAVMGIGVMFAPMLGPTLGGYLTEYMNWRWIFYINLFPGLLATLMAFWILRDEKPRPIPFDTWGFSLMAIFLSTLLLAVSQGNTKGWDNDYIVALFAIAAVTFAGYLVTAFWRTHPVIDLRLFKYVTYSAGTIVSIVVGVALFGGVFLLPVFLQNLMGYDAIQTGLMMMPQGLALATVMPVSNMLMRKFDPRVPMTIGMILLAISLFLQAGMTPETSTIDILFWTALRGWGLGLTFPPMNQTSLGAVPIQKIGQASGLFNVTRQLGGSFGIAALSTLLTQRTVHHQAVLGQAAAHTGQAAPLIGSLQQHFLHAGSSPDWAMYQAQATFAGAAMKQASVYAFQDCFYAAAVLALLGIIPAMFMQKSKAPGGDAAAAAHAVME